MKKILFADPHILGETIGGAEVQLWMLACGFRDAGWQVHYVTDAALSEQKREGISLHSLAATKNQEPREDFYHLLSGLEPDVIYQRGRKSYTGLSGKYASDTGTPFVFATSMDIDCRKYKELGRIFLQNRTLIQKLRLVPHRLKQDRASLLGMKRASVIFAQSELQRQLLQTSLSLQSRVVRNLHPVPTPDTIAKSSPPIVLWLASVKKWKRPGLFLELAEAFRGSAYRFVLAGRLADREMYEAQLNEYSEQNKNFTYIEEVDLEESNRLIANASVFINTSLPYEGFPNTFIQSWLRSTITLSLGVDPDGLISTNDIGRVCDDVQDMKVKLAELLENRKLRESMGSRARDMAVREFGFEENFRKIESFVHGLVENN